MNAPAQTVFTRTLGRPRRRMGRRISRTDRKGSAPRPAAVFCTPPANRLFGLSEQRRGVLDQDLMKKGSRLCVDNRRVACNVFSTKT